ncbi:MAG: hypothetical protein JW804_04470 [Sedimentisphaerales bacterium]|nr:hypothetical protein [Sedimentisphaerales bacterium]
MLALIKREIRDNAVFFLLAIILAGITNSILLPGFAAARKDSMPVGIPTSMYSIFAFIIIVLPLLALAMGGAQTYLDSKKKISSFLSTLAVTRKQLLFTKVIAGIIWLIVPLALIALADIVFLTNYPSLIPVEYSLLVNMFAVTFLCSLACYLLGMYLGLSQSRIPAIIGGFFIYIVIISLIIIKGFGPETMMIYSVLSLVLVFNFCRRFLSISL